MPRELRAAIVGAGFMGSAHARAVRLAGARLAGVAASTPTRAKEAAVVLGADRSYSCAEDAVRDPDVDVVHLCVPNSLHHDLVMAALSEQKHVICEKPLTTNVAQATAVVSALHAAGTVGAVPFVYRYHPMARELRARAGAGELGSIHLVHGTYLQDWLSEPGDENWRLDPASGGPSRAVADIGSHWFDLAEFVIGEPIARVSAQVATVLPGRRTEDQAVVQLQTASGTIGSVVISQITPGRKNHLTLECSGLQGTGRFEQEQPGSLWIGSRTHGQLLAADPAYLSADATKRMVAPAGHPHGYLDCIDSFVADVYAAIDGEEVLGLPDFSDGRRAVAITEAVLASAAADGAWTEIAP